MGGKLKNYDMFHFYRRNTFLTYIQLQTRSAAEDRGRKCLDSSTAVLEQRDSATLVRRRGLYINQWINQSINYSPSTISSAESGTLSVTIVNVLNAVLAYAAASSQMTIVSGPPTNFHRHETMWTPWCFSCSGLWLLKFHFNHSVADNETHPWIVWFEFDSCPWTSCVDRFSWTIGTPSASNSTASTIPHTIARNTSSIQRIIIHVFSQTRQFYLWFYVVSAVRSIVKIKKWNWIWGLKRLKIFANLSKHRLLVTSYRQLIRAILHASQHELIN